MSADSEIQRFSTIEGAGENPFIVNIEGFEGPLDLLLAMSRTQKLDLREINVLELAEAYLEFVREAQALRIELAADYLVMAAWLAFLKSRLLLPPDPQDEGPSPDEMAAHLAFQLERLAAMRDAAKKLMARAQLGMHRFARGDGEALETERSFTHKASLYDLLQAYARIKTRDDFTPLHYDRGPVLTMEEALDRMRGFLGDWVEWRDLVDFVPREWRDDPSKIRSAIAANFAASLQLSKEGLVEIQQDELFGRIRMQRIGQGIGRDG